MEKRTYLTRLAASEQRNHTRRPCRLKGRVYYVKRGLKGVSFENCRILNISEAGCLMQPEGGGSVQSHFYLAVEGLEEPLAVAVVGHSNTGFHVEFQKGLTSEAIDGLVRKNRTGRSRRVH